ncbi:MAG: DNA polymerase III subunit gamma/tau [Anaerolineae bacterium]
MTTQAQALYRRWRPQTFADVVGQEHITRTLQNAVAGDRLAHAYLFTGPRGTGKTSVARILAKAVNCTGDGERPCNACAICESMTAGRSLDLIEIDAASNTGVDDVRDLRDKISFAPNEATFKVYIVDEVHMLSTAAFNALLKTLEEPPPHALFVLATTEPHKIPDTIASRCQRQDFRRVPLDAIVGKLQRICAAEGVEAEPAALELVARSATGSIRDAESLLDQLRAAGDAVSVGQVRQVLGTPAEGTVADLVDALIDGDGATGLRLIGAAMDQGVDARQFREMILDHLRCLLLLQAGVEGQLLGATDAQLDVLESQAERMPRRALLGAVHRFSEARPSSDMSQPALPLELALVETVLDLTDDGPAVAETRPARPKKPARAVRGTGKSRPTDAEGGGTDVPASREAADAPPAGADARASREAADAQSAVVQTPGGGKPDDAAAASPEPEGPAEPAEAMTADAEASGQGGPPGDEPDIAAMTDLERARAAWPRVIEVVKRTDKKAAALLRDGRPVAIDESTLTVGFYYEFHCGKVSEVKNSELVAAAAAEVLGAPVALRCTVVPADREDSTSRPRTLADQAKQDPVVKHAVENLGARIASVSKDRGD